MPYDDVFLVLSQPKPVHGLEVRVNSLINGRSATLSSDDKRRIAALNTVFDNRDHHQAKSPSQPTPHCLPRIQRIGPNLPMPNPTFSVKVTESICEILLPALTRTLTRKRRVCDYADHPGSASRGINDEVRAWRKSVRVGNKGKNISEEADVVSTCAGRRVCRGMSRVLAAMKGATEEGQTKGCSRWAVLGDFWGGGKVSV